jgi:hypothetical protein
LITKKGNEQFKKNVKIVITLIIKMEHVSTSISSVIDIPANSEFGDIVDTLTGNDVDPCSPVVLLHLSRD